MGVYLNLFPDGGSVEGISSAGFSNRFLHVVSRFHTNHCYNRSLFFIFDNFLLFHKNNMSSDENKYEKLTLKELVVELRKRNAKTTGKKAELIER